MLDDNGRNIGDYLAPDEAPTRDEAWDAMQEAGDDVIHAAHILAAFHLQSLAQCYHGRRLLHLLDVQMLAYDEWCEARDEDEARRLIESVPFEGQV